MNSLLVVENVPAKSFDFWYNFRPALYVEEKDGGRLLSRRSGHRLFQ